IKGTFFVQIDSIDSITTFNNNKNQLEQTDDNNSLLLTITDGITTVKGITNDYIPNLSFNIRPGCKLLLTGIISIKDGLLQLTHDNTRFQHGSNTYSRPRSAYRGRGGGSHRPSYEGRRGGTGNSNNRYDNNDNTSNFLKGPPPKNTLMDFMTSVKISNDFKQTIDNDNQKLKDRHENKRRNTDQYYKTINNINTTNNSNQHYQSNNNNYYYTDQIIFQQEGIHDQLDTEDDSSHANYRERRNPLPPRLQRAQEERTRRSTNRYLDESTSLTENEINGNYRNGTTNNNTLSSSSSYTRHGDPMSYIPHNLSNGQPHATTLNSYPPHGNILAPAIGSTPTHLAYFPTNSGHLTYSLAGIPSPTFHSQQPSMGPGYTNEHLTFCYRTPFVTATYLPSTTTNDIHDDSKTNYNNNNNNSTVLQTDSYVDENEIKPTNESQQDENNENKSQSSLIEQKTTSSSSSSSSSSSASSNDGNNSSQQVIVEQDEDKRRDINSNSQIRWKIGDICLARWSEDQEYYVATIVHIQPPYCTVLFRDYNNYDKLHFSELKILPRDQQYYQYVPQIAATSHDLNVLTTNVCFPPRTNYYPSTIDECIIMPEAPPFPFNSAGTLYMCPPTLTSISRSNNRYNTNGLSSFQQTNKYLENENIHDTNHINNDTTINSSSTLSKDSNDTSIIDSTTISIDDNQQLQAQQQDISLSTEGIQRCSIDDESITIVTKDNERERSTSTESLTSSKYDEQNLTNEEVKQENNSVTMTDENTIEFQSASSEIHNDNNSSFILNQTNVPMDIDVDNEIIKSDSTKINGDISPILHTIENENNNEQNNEDVLRPGNTELNKSFDILPQTKDDDISAADSISDNSAPNNNILDTTVELSVHNDEYNEKRDDDLNSIIKVNDIETPTSAKSLLTNQFSLEYPYEIPQPQENVQPSSPIPIETVTTLTKNMKLDINKTLEEQEPSILKSSTDKTYDTNTFVLKKRERRKISTLGTENTFNKTVEDSPPDLSSKKSPSNTPSVSQGATITSRSTTTTLSSQQSLMDPTRIM
ncbi:unnamed protein product, partial [Rotaria sp. Silwood1]